MARKSKQQVELDTHARAMAGFRAAYEATADQRAAALEDRRFHTVVGAQWDGAFGEAFGNRPKIEVDMTHKQVKRAETEYRENRITVDFISKAGAKPDTDLADICDDLFRADAMDSQADEAIDNCFIEGIGGGFGAWRLTCDYEDDEDEDDERQRIRFIPIYEADQHVYFDPNAKLYDKSDAAWAILIQPMARSAFEEEYPDVDPASWPLDTAVSTPLFAWSTPDNVYIAEYFERAEAKTTVYKYEGPAGEPEKLREDAFDSPEDFTAAEDGLFARGFTLIGAKQIKRRVVNKWILTGAGILKDCGRIAGCEIPIVPFYGERAIIDGAEHSLGMVRKVKDAQRLRNMQVSTLAEIAATGGTDTPIFTPEQVSGHEYAWANSAQTNPAFLLLNAVYDQVTGQMLPSGPIAFKQAPQIPPAMAALITQMTSDIDTLMGSQDNGDEYSSNLSGKAVELVQTRLDRQVYLYMSNLAKSMKRCGHIWLGMARDVYVEDSREMRAVSDTDSVDFVTINRPEIDPDHGLVRGADISRAKFDVAVDVGAASSSARAGMVRTLVSMLQFATTPEDQSVLFSHIVRNLEGDGIGAIREYYRRKMVQIGVEEPTDEDRQRAADQARAQQSQPLSAQDQFLMAEAQKSASMAEKARADTARAIADTTYTEARTAETLAGINTERQRAAIEAANALREAATAPLPNELGRVTGSAYNAG